MPLVPAEPKVLQSTSVDWKRLWSLGSSMAFLNHGSVEACPVAVLVQQQALRQPTEAISKPLFAHGIDTLVGVG